MSANRISDVDDNDFFVEDTSSQTTPQQCSLLKLNGFVVIKNRPCKLVELDISKVGKHGHSKVHLVGIDIFTSKKYEMIHPASYIVQVPIVLKKEYQLVDISNDGFATLYDPIKRETKLNVRLPEGEIGNSLADKFDGELKEILVTVMRSMNDEAIISFKSQ